MGTRTNTTEMHPAAEQLAAALRSGLELRWPVPLPPVDGPGPFPPGGSVRAFLTPYADALTHRLPCRRKLLHRVVRRGLYLIRQLFAPWLRLQSRFNYAAISVVEQIDQRLRALEDAERTLRRTIDDLEKTLREKV